MLTVKQTVYRRKKKLIAAKPKSRIGVSCKGVTIKSFEGLTGYGRKRQWD